MQRALIVLVLAVLAGLIVMAVRSRPSAPPASIAAGAHGPMFEVEIVRPWSERPLFGLLEEIPPRFDQSSPGARIGSVGPTRLELGADGWELVLETDAGGKIAPGTRLVFPFELADQLRDLRCAPADGASGFLRTTTRGDGELDGEFVVELATCVDAGTGTAIDWPPAPLTVRGRFAGLPAGVR